MRSHSQDLNYHLLSLSWLLLVLSPLHAASDSFLCYLPHSSWTAFLTYRFTLESLGFVTKEIYISCCCSVMIAKGWFGELPLCCHFKPGSLSIFLMYLPTEWYDNCTTTMGRYPYAIAQKIQTKYHMGWSRSVEYHIFS